jgi:hypothetical protein
MKIFQKKKDGSQPKSRIEKRVSTIGTYDLILWAENALYVIGKEITHHQRDKDSNALYEAELGAEALLAIVRELQKRSND